MKYQLIFLAIILPTFLSAQHQLGWRTDQYAGINAAFINPANTARTPYGWDLNIAEGNFFFSNNYAFFEQSGVPSLIKAFNNEKTSYLLRDDLATDSNIGENELVYDFSDQSSYFAQQNTNILGPSLSFRVAPMTRIGVFSRYQAMTSLRDFDQDIGYDNWNAIPDNTSFTFDAARVTTAAWSEVGLNLTQGFILNNGDLQIGINGRRLNGKRAVYFLNTTDFTLSKLPSYTGLEAIEFDIKAGFTNNITAEDNFNQSAGNGWGLDIGFLYQIDLGDDYFRWEIGAAVLDIGQINFEDAQKHRFNNSLLSSTLNDNYDNLSETDALQELTQILSQDVLGDSLVSLQANEISIHLPTALSFQVAYRFNEWIKLEGNIITSIAPKDKASLSHATTIGITPRMDRHWWSVGMPISLYAGQEVRLGLSARLGPVFIGTDEIGSFFKQDEFNSTDIYFGVKFFPLGFGRNKNKKSKNKRSKGGKAVECYKF